MAIFQRIPNELHLEIMQQVLDAPTLLALVDASEDSRNVFRQYHLVVLESLIEKILPTHPNLVHITVQARCSNKHMSFMISPTSRTVHVSSDKYDIWHSNFAGDPVDALRHLTDLTHEVQGFSEMLMGPEARCPKGLILAGVKTIEEAIWSMQANRSRKKNCLPEERYKLSKWFYYLKVRRQLERTISHRTRAVRAQIESFLYTFQGRDFWRKLSGPQRSAFERGTAAHCGAFCTSCS